MEMIADMARAMRGGRPARDAQAAAAPTLSQGLAQMEGQSKHEQEALRTAVVDGGRTVRGNVAWSVSALEL